jgi:hypothetical protein
VASDPTISRLIDTLAEDPGLAIAAIRAARAAARARVWGHRYPMGDIGPVVIDLDATLVGSYSDKEGATPNFKRGFGFHSLLAFVDHGAGGTGEPLAAMLRPGKANANDAGDQIAVLDWPMSRNFSRRHNSCPCTCCRAATTAPPTTYSLGDTERAPFSISIRPTQCRLRGSTITAATLSTARSPMTVRCSCFMPPNSFVIGTRTSTTTSDRADFPKFGPPPKQDDGPTRTVPGEGCAPERVGGRRPIPANGVRCRHARRHRSHHGCSHRCSRHPPNRDIEAQS